MTSIAIGALLALIGIAAALLAYIRVSRPAQDEAKLVRVGRLATLGEITSSLAHEINNPLMYVMANLEFVADDDRLPTDLVEAIRDAQDGSMRIASMVRDLKTFGSAADDEEVETLDLDFVCNSVTRVLRAYVRKRANLVLDLNGPATVDAKFSELSHVVINLAVNATHAIDKGSPDDNEVRIETSSDESSAVLRVVDSGRGIAPADRDRVFDPFVSIGESSATGLGLTVSRQIVRSLGGEIALDSQLDGGTTVTVTLPASVAKDRYSRLTLPGTLAHLRFMVLDPDSRVREGIARMLADHEVVTAATAQEARAALDESSFDLILIDVENFPGLDLSGAEIERVVYLASTQQHDSQNPHSDRTIDKPLGRDQLRELVYRFAADRREVAGNS